MLPPCRTGLPSQTIPDSCLKCHGNLCTACEMELQPESSASEGFFVGIILKKNKGGGFFLLCYPLLVGLKGKGCQCRLPRARTEQSAAERKA